MTNEEVAAQLDEFARLKAAAVERLGKTDATDAGTFHTLSRQVKLYDERAAQLRAMLDGGDSPPAKPLPEVVRTGVLRTAGRPEPAAEVRAELHPEAVRVMRRAVEDPEAADRMVGKARLLVEEAAERALAALAQGFPVTLTVGGEAVATWQPHRPHPILTAARAEPLGEVDIDRPETPLPKTSDGRIPCDWCGALMDQMATDDVGRLVWNCPSCPRVVPVRPDEQNFRFPCPRCRQPARVGVSAGRREDWECPSCGFGWCMPPDQTNGVPVPYKPNKEIYPENPNPVVRVADLAPEPAAPEIPHEVREEWRKEGARLAGRDARPAGIGAIAFELGALSGVWRDRARLAGGELWGRAADELAEVFSRHRGDWS